MAERIEARGGTGQGDTTVVIWDGAVVEVLHETGGARFHASMVDRIDLAEHPGPSGQALNIVAKRTGTTVNTRFEGDERGKLDQIIAAVLAHS